MPKSKAKARPAGAERSRHILSQQWKVLRIIAPGLVLALIAYLVTSDHINDVVLENIGFAFVLWLLWLGPLYYVVRKRKWRTLAARWNVWLGVLCLTFAVWGILSMITPARSELAGVDLGEVSLGGNAGMYLIGNQGVGVLPAVRLALLIVVAIALIAPTASAYFLRRAGRGVTEASATALPVVGRLSARSAAKTGQLYSDLSPHRRLARAIAAPFRRSRRPEPVGGAGLTPAPAVAAPDEGRFKEARERPLSEPELPGQPPRDDDVPREKTREVEPVAVRVDAAEKGQMPPYSLLDDVVPAEFAEADNLKRAKLIEEALASYGVEAQVVQINPGPSVTQFGVEPGWDRKYKRMIERDQQGKPKLDRDGNQIERQEEVSRTRVKVERITSLSQNLALALAVPSIRIEAPVPGQPLVGIEVPNTDSVAVGLKSVIESTSFQRIKAKSKLALALGLGAAGEPVAADLGKMPHLLIAGTTGSGKSVCLNSIVTCLLMHNHPRDVRLMIIDPKQVEFVQFASVPHLISPLVTKLDKAVDALRRVIREMDSRFEKFAAVGVRNIEKYNQSPLAAQPMPWLVVIVDELNQLMWFSSEVVEASICRLAQLGRATGIHLILATQRPSTDVITGVIKANFPARIAFKLPAYVDSRTILDTGGAEKLLGGGDMIYLPSDTSKARRLRGCFVSDHEIDRLARFWCQPQDVLAPETGDEVAQAFASLPTEEDADEDALLPAARRLAKDTSHVSTSLIQRRLHVGYPRAARIMDTLEKEGVVVRGDHGAPDEVIEPVEEEE